MKCCDFVAVLAVGLLSAAWGLGDNLWPPNREDSDNDAQRASELVSSAEPASASWRRVEQSRYVGSKTCQECHEDHHKGWRSTRHAKMIREAVSEGAGRTILADFSHPDPSSFTPQDIKWVIGSRWKQRFIGEVDGQEVVFPAQWSVAQGAWQSYSGRTDWWYNYHKDWRNRSNFQLCHGCHSTGADVYTQSWVEHNIACERCHGPGKVHAEDPVVGNIVNPARLSRDRAMDICESCHLSGKPPGTDYAWPVGYEPGLKLADFWEASEPEAGKQTSEFWPNGTAHKNRVQGNTFRQSRMYHAGLQCTSCHDPHGSRHGALTIKSTHDNALCLMCHGPGKQAGPQYGTISDHTHHAPNSAGSRCIECHMPLTGKNSLAGESRNHSFQFISPAETIALGVPNSCNGCHNDKPPQWALSELEKWSPPRNGSRLPGRGRIVGEP